MARSLSGRLVVAAPLLVDPNFVRTVVLILDHGDDGAVGVVLNRTSETRVDDVLAGWGDAASEPRLVFVGGPVQPEAAVCLARSGRAEVEPALSPLLSWAWSLDLDADPSSVAPHLDAMRVFAGYAGWGPGQLEGEIDHEDWFVVESLPSDPFDADPETLWRRVLKRQGGSLEMVAAFPPHPRVN